MLGYPLHRWYEPGFWRANLHPEDAARVTAVPHAGLPGGAPHEREYRVLAMDGRTVWLHDTVRVLRDRDGAPRQLRGVLVDVTARKAAEHAAALAADAAGPPPGDTPFGAPLSAALGADFGTNLVHLPPRGEGTILVVDDDPEVRSTTRLLLEYLGYSVFDVPDGATALTTLAAGGLFAAVLLDLTMPAMNGVETLARIRAAHPTLPVVVSTGYHYSLLTGQVEEQAATAILRKPFTLHQLASGLARARRGAEQVGPTF
jgi:CheY-like chemotaxis protein